MDEKTYKVLIHKASPGDFEELVTISTIEDLLALKERFGDDLILQPAFNCSYEPQHDFRILVYDDYIE